MFNWNPNRDYFWLLRGYDHHDPGSSSISGQGDAATVADIGVDDPVGHSNVIRLHFADPSVPGSAGGKGQEEFRKVEKDEGGTRQEPEIGKGTPTYDSLAQPAFDSHEPAHLLEPVEYDAAVRASQVLRYLRLAVAKSGSGKANAKPLQHENAKRPRQSQSLASRMIRTAIVLSLHSASCEGAMVVAPVLHMPENGTNKGEASLKTPNNKAELLGILGIVFGVVALLVMCVAYLARARRGIERRRLGNRNEPHHPSSSHISPPFIPLRDHRTSNASRNAHHCCYTIVNKIGQVANSSFGINRAPMSSAEYPQDGGSRSGLTAHPPPLASYGPPQNAHSSYTLRSRSPLPNDPEPTEMTPLGRGE
ncbi:hypothetical protein NMY22_g13411 [Coprinellus aureogranulatus]|nr:hypothetical protein NMY22_g13411 [Coprinellus aureogranulatus]